MQEEELDKKKDIVEAEHNMKRQLKLKLKRVKSFVGYLNEDTRSVSSMKDKEEKKAVAEIFIGKFMLQRKLSMAVSEIKKNIGEFMLNNLSRVNSLREKPLSKKIITIINNIVNHVRFSLFMAICILLNTVILSLVSYGQSFKEIEIVETINLVLTIIFIIEMVLKLIGLGIRG